MADGIIPRQATRPDRVPPKPRDGKCPGCDRRVGRPALGWHHCHDCGRFVAWLCNDCNLTLTEHAIKNWDHIWRVHIHDCHPPPQLFETADLPELKPSDRLTRPLYMSNGGGDDRYVSTSKLDGYVTVEQLAAICGINANSARDLVNGRRGGPPLAVRKDGTLFVAHGDVLTLLEKRWQLTDT